MSYGVEVDGVLNFGFPKKPRDNEENLRIRMLYFMALDTYNHYYKDKWQSSEAGKEEMWAPTSKPTRLTVWKSIDEHLGRQK